MSLRSAAGGMKCLAFAASLASCNMVFAAPQWQQLGPTGGPVAVIATGPAGSGKVYALGDAGYVSTNGGLSWEISGPRPNGLLIGLMVRSDGQVLTFDYSSGRIWRSTDGMRSWTSDGLPLNASEPVFDPRDPQRAVVVLESGYATKQGDTNPWQISSTPTGEFGPTHVIFDPTVAGQLLGVGMVSQTLCQATYCHSTYTLKLFKSVTFGASWLDAGVIVPTRSDQCYHGALQADTAGRLFIRTRCGFLRSADAGTTWQWLKSGTGEVRTYDDLGVDPSMAGRLIQHGDGRLYESRDAGDSWQPLPPPPSGSRLHIGTAGELWAANPTDTLRYEAASTRWLPRNTGLPSQAIAITQIEPAFAKGTVLTAVAGDHALQSLDDGLTWRPLALGNAAVVEITRHAANPNNLLARAVTGGINERDRVDQMFDSHDGGASWQLLAVQDQLPNGHLITGWVPAGPQPGVVYGIERQYHCSMLLCSWSAYHNKGVAKSLDGGKTWTGAEDNTPSWTTDVLVSPVDRDTVLAYHHTGEASPVSVTRDGGHSWKGTVWSVIRSVAGDPEDPAGWYLLSRNDRTSSFTFRRIGDYGATWQTLSDLPSGSDWNNLLLGGDRIYAIASGGAVAVSNDRGETWHRILDEQPNTHISNNTARRGATASTIYASGSGGVVKLDLEATEVQPRTGLWVLNAENNGQSGRGFQVEGRNGILAFTYFGYGANGDGKWYLATGAIQNGQASADMVEYRGGTALGGPYTPARAEGNAGVVALSFSSPTTGTLTLPGESARPISKFAFSGSSLPDVAPTNGLWIIEAENTGESGRGFHIEQNANELAFTYYGYAGDSNGVWYLAAGSLNGNQFAGQLTTYRGGTVLGGAYAPAVASGGPGEVRITFTSPTTGTITLPGETTRPMRKFTW